MVNQPDFAQGQYLGVICKLRGKFLLQLSIAGWQTTPRLSDLKQQQCTQQACALLDRSFQPLFEGSAHTFTTSPHLIFSSSRATEFPSQWFRIKSNTHFVTVVFSLAFLKPYCSFNILFTDLAALHTPLGGHDPQPFLEWVGVGKVTVVFRTVIDNTLLFFYPRRENRKKKWTVYCGKF